MQRATLAIALALNPDVLLLDGKLDLISRKDKGLHFINCDFRTHISIRPRIN